MTEKPQTTPADIVRRFNEWTPPAPTALVAPRNDDPEGILLYGIQRIAQKSTPEKGGGFLIMDAMGANGFAGEILLAYWKAKAMCNAK